LPHLKVELVLAEGAAGRRADRRPRRRHHVAVREGDADPVSHWLRDQERAGHIGAGTTLHGLRVSYAAWWRRNGANTREAADLMGDESERMGAHYTRHVEAEQNTIRTFSRISDGPDKA
jgi:integrase